MVIQMKGNQLSRKAFESFLFWAQHLKITKQHQDSKGKGMESFFSLYMYNQIRFNSFPYFISPSNPKTLFTFPLLITFCNFVGYPLSHLIWCLKPTVVK